MVVSIYGGNFFEWKKENIFCHDEIKYVSLDKYIILESIRIYLHEA